MYDQFRIAMETASMLIVALEKVEFKNEAYRQNLETQLYDLLTQNHLPTPNEDAPTKGMSIIK